MRKLIFPAIIALSSFTMLSCEKETKLFDGQEGIYFSVQYGAAHGNEQVWAHQHFTPVEFINVIGNEKIVELKVMTTGRIKDYDRHFSIAVVPDTTTAVEGREYERLPELFTIKAGEYFTIVPIKVFRNEVIADERKDLVLQLLPNEDFTIGIPEWKRLPNFWEGARPGEFRADLHKVELSDFVARPAQWIGLIQATGLEAGFWGGFTEKKYRLICEHFDLVYEDFATTATMPQARKEIIREYMVRHLQKMYDEGNPILEEDGRLMWFMGVSWTSYEGVPWVPSSK